MKFFMTTWACMCDLILCKLTFVSEALAQRCTYSRNDERSESRSLCADSSKRCVELGISVPDGPYRLKRFECVIGGLAQIELMPDEIIDSVSLPLSLRVSVPLQMPLVSPAPVVEPKASSSEGERLIPLTDSGDCEISLRRVTTEVLLPRSSSLQERPKERDIFSKLSDKCDKSSYEVFTIWRFYAPLVPQYTHFHTNTYHFTMRVVVCASSSISSLSSGSLNSVSRAKFSASTLSRSMEWRNWCFGRILTK